MKANEMSNTTRKDGILSMSNSQLSAYKITAAYRNNAIPKAKNNGATRDRLIIVLF
ncbi:hypothetical protein SAMN05216327_106376 [Dyadobacter sp. SG02]|nr:hypothetical protein SAMN05216327_106376 [Dyadobacter sp. SG02]